MNLLLVDDRPLNLKLLKVILQSEGHQTAEAADGVEALERLRERPFDAVISDILMPNMDGYRLCRAVRQDPALQHVALVIYTSTYVSPGDKDLAGRSGADAYLTKPSPAKELLRAIDDAVIGRRGSPVAGTYPLEEVFLRQYNEALIHKLEERNIDLEEKTRLLVESDQKFRTLVDNLKVTFMLLGTGGRPVLYVSPAYESMWERTCHSLYLDPDSWMEHIVQEDLEEARKVLNPHPGTLDIEFRLKSRAGTLRWIRFRSVPALNARGALLGICGIAEDTTLLKVTEAQFQHAHKMESVGILAGGVAHDFNNILTAISGFSTLAARPEADHESIVRYTQTIEKLVAKGARLTRQLLAFSRQQTIASQVVDLASMLDEFARLIGPVLGDDVVLLVEKEPSAFHVKIDPGQIEQVLMNLCLNARDAMPLGGNLTLALGRVNQVREGEKAGGPWVSLAVRDTGVGMSPEVMQRVFDPFFTTKEVGKGTGLGLAAAYGIVTQSGGYLKVESQPAVGSTFTVLLPEVHEPLPTPTLPEIRPVGKKLSTTILVVDDDVDVATITFMNLKESGFEALVAHSGSEALELVAQDSEKKIRLILTDIVMPQMNGGQLAEAVGKTRPDIQFIFASGYTHASILEKGIRIETSQILLKPFSLEDLLERIGRFVGEG